MKERLGHTLAELLVVLPMALLVTGLVLGAVAGQLRLSRQLAELSSRAEAERFALAVVPAELRWAAAGDLRTASPDSVRLRVFRGFAVPCGAGAGLTWYGMRAPEPAKDSLLVLSGGAETLSALTGVAGDADCDGYRLDADPALGAGVVLVFETGTYYLRDRALRFRTGAEGRQPLTHEWFIDGGSRFEPSATGTPTGLALLLRPVAGNGGPELSRIGFALPNHVEVP